MPLTEEQIVRFSRQILLREVGGVGQQKLLASGLRVRGAGAGVWTAAAYVAAGGGSVELPAQSAPSFPVTPGGAPPQDAFTLCAAGAPIPAEGAVIVLGADRIAFGRGDACRECLRAVQGEPSVRDADLLGALAALVQQRWALGEDDAGALVLNARGGIDRKPLSGCSAHP